MQRIGDAATVTGGPISGREGVGVAASLNPRNVRSGPIVDCQLATRPDHAQDAMHHLIPRQPISPRQRQHPACPPLPHPERLQVRPLPPILEENRLQATRVRYRAKGTRASTRLLPTAKLDRSERSWFQRLVSLSGLGWAFVLVGVIWGLFAVAFSQCDGCGWDKGEYFFAWALGILVFGFCLRTSRKRSAVSNLFLAVNVLMVSILSMLVATR
jgi:hypothetical protein